MKLSASKAAKEVGVSIPTITRAIKSGRMSADPVEGGGWLIDTNELFRVFEAVKANTNETPDGLGRETPPLTPLLEVENRFLRQQVELLNRVADDLRQDRDHWQEQAARILLSASPIQAAAPAAPPVEPPSTTTPRSGRAWWPFSRLRAAH